MAENPQSDPFLPEVRRVRIERLTIYDVSESELETLEKGSPVSLYLNFAIALLSVAASFTATLMTATVGPTARTFFIALTVVGYTGGVFLLLLWRKSHTALTSCAQNIRDRRPPEGKALEPPRNS